MLTCRGFIFYTFANIKNRLVKKNAFIALFNLSFLKLIAKHKKTGYNYFNYFW